MTFTLCLSTQEHSPAAEVPPHPAQPLLPPAQKLRCLSMEMHSGSSVVLTSSKPQVQAFPQSPPFPSVSVMMPTLRAFAFDYSPELRLVGKTLPSFGSSSQPCLSSSWAPCCEQPWLNSPVPPKKEWLMSFPEETDSSDFKWIHV